MGRPTLVTLDRSLRAAGGPLTAALALLGSLAACGSSGRPGQGAAVGTSANRSATAPGAADGKANPAPPTPGSPTVKEPGGDSTDPAGAALLRQLSEGWGVRTDKDDQLSLPLADWQHWKRVRYWGVEHFVGFRYGDDHHALTIGFVQEVPVGTPVNTDTCMRRFEAWGRPQTKPFDVKFGPFQVHHQRWHDQRLEVHSVDGEFAAGFSSTEFSAAWAAYPAYANACLVYAVAVPWRDHPDLARQVRDRWVKEGFSLIEPKTAERPLRK